MSREAAHSNKVEVDSVINETDIGGFQWRVVALCFCIAMVDGFDTQAVAFVAPVIKDIFEIGPQGIGNLYSAGLFGLMVGALTFGALADRIGRKPVIILSCFLMGIFSLLTATASGLEELLIYRFLTGLGLGASMPNINSLTAEYAPKRRQAFLMTLMFAGFPTGAILGGILSVRLIEIFGWQSVFVLGGAVPLALVLILIWALPESLRYRATSNPQDDIIGKILSKISTKFTPRAGLTYVIAEMSFASPRSKIPVMDLFTNGRAGGTFLIWLIYFGNFLMMYSLLGWLPTVISDAGLGLAGGIYTAVAFNVGGVVGGLTIAWLIDQQKGYMALFIGYLLAFGTAALVGSLGASLLWALTVIFVSGLTLMGGAFAMNAFSAAYYPTFVRSTGLGWGLAIGRIGAIVGPVIIGAAFAANWSVTTVFTIIGSPGIVCAASILLLGVLTRKMRRAEAERWKTEV